MKEEQFTKIFYLIPPFLRNSTKSQTDIEE